MHITNETNEVLQFRPFDFCWIPDVGDSLGNKSYRSSSKGSILMLTLYTSGYSYSKRRCERIVDWFVQKHLPRHKLEIVINHRGMLRDGVYGWVGVTDFDYRPRSFEIELHNQMDPEHYTVVLLHELWHVYQHVMGALRDKYGKRHWRGIDHSLTDYSEQPWEQQAFEMEQVLYEEFLNHLTDTQQPL